MAQFTYDLIVIGGGAGGLTASTFAGQSGAKTLLVEKEKKLGGDCLHFGCVPSKSLIKSSYAYHVVRNSEKYGLPKADIAPVDFRKVAGRIRQIIGTIQEHDEPGYLSEQYNVETRFGSPRFIDAHTVILNEEKITSRYFILATGSSPFVPPIPGLDKVPFLTNVDIFSLDKLPASLAVLGGGPIGVEIAQAFSRLGSRVTVIEALSQLLPKEDTDVSAFVRDRLQSEGIEVLLNNKAVEVSQGKGMVCIRLEPVDGQDRRTIESESLLVAVGRRANTSGLDLEKAGVAFDRSGIKTDDTMRTTAKNIYACGDVTGGLQFTHVAGYEAVVAVFNAILRIPKRADYSCVPWCTYLDPEVASIGLNEKRAREAGIAYTARVERFLDNDRALAEGETEGFIKILVGPKKRPIGVQIVGFHAGDLIHEWVPVFNRKMKLSAVSDAIHAYPTLAEISKNASVKYLVSTIPAWTKRVTKLLFGYRGKV